MLELDIVCTQSPLPSGKQFNHIGITITDSAGASQTQFVDGVSVLSATFDNVATGSGTYSVQAFDTTNAALGDAVTGTFVIPTITTFPQPSSVTVKVS